MLTDYTKERMEENAKEIRRHEYVYEDDEVEMRFLATARKRTATNKREALLKLGRTMDDFEKEMFENTEESSESIVDKAKEIHSSLEKAYSKKGLIDVIFDLKKARIIYVKLAIFSMYHQHEEAT